MRVTFRASRASDPHRTLGPSPGLPALRLGPSAQWDPALLEVFEVIGFLFGLPYGIGTLWITEMAPEGPYTVSKQANTVSK